MGQTISEQDVQAICRRTEGWVAAMQLSALSGSNSSLDERHISDYVLSEVLDKQPSDIVAFLLDTACCPRLCASLCNIIRNTDDGQLLWQRTVEWLLEHGQVQEAIAQIVQKQDWPWLADVLAAHGNNLIHGGYHLPVLAWLDPVAMKKAPAT